ncbi:MAG TPA: FAD-dependent oxidoreductase [Pyrinomonadaceae bacterium]|nr:FAD-dependent oxidoreductase [Pyrinomonadaceae bacterium]
MTSPKTFDVAVVGAGVFGAWTTLELKRSGADVVLLDAYGPGNSRASSGGESRIIRMGYGPDEIYTRMAHRSLDLWQTLFEQTADPHLFQPTGVLWLARQSDAYCEATLAVFEKLNIQSERLDRSQLLERYPQLEPGPATWGILEPRSGVLLARQAVQAVVRQAQEIGASYVQEAIVAPETDAQSTLDSVQTSSGGRIVANQFVFACGPWLPKLFPELLGELIHVTRQEVFFFGSLAAQRPGKDLPAWIDFNDLVYGIPDLEHRGFKIAIDAHGPQFDPDTGDRIVSADSVTAVRAYLARRMPGLTNAPVTETRVCQYENTSNGDFLIDRHPAFTNVWLAGGGSGHGFKHGPAVGEHVAGLLANSADAEPRFSLATKQRVQQRRVY